jgi:hypothetical protein
MTATDGFDRDLRAWLEAEASLTAPGGLHADVIRQARNARQRPAWLVSARGDAFGGTPGVGPHPGRRTLALMVVLGLLLVAALAALVAGQRRNDLAIEPGRNGAILVTVQDDSRGPDGGTFVLGIDGRSTRAAEAGYCAAYSRDGGMTSWMEGDLVPGPRSLRVLSGDGAMTEVPIDVMDYRGDRRAYALSPDGTHVAWIRLTRVVTSDDGSLRPGTQTELLVAPVAGGTPIRIAARPADATADYGIPTWSPDGRRLAFETWSGVFGDGSSAVVRTAIDIVDADGSNLRRLTTRPAVDAWNGPSWSPDGRFIAFVALPDGTPLPAGPGTSSPRPDAPNDIFVIGADGAGERNLTNSSRSTEIATDWSPDGSRLAYLSAGADEPIHLTTIPMRGGEPDGPPAAGPEADWIVWSPDGTRLLVAERSSRPATQRDASSTRTVLRSVDRDFRESPTTLFTFDDASILCQPSWQRLEP